MSPYPNGGDKFKRGAWYAAPGIAPMTLEERQHTPVRPVVAPAALAGPVERPKLEWVASELRGPRTLTLRGNTFHLPLEAQVKRRPPLAWVLFEGQVFVLSERGDLLLDARDRLRFAELWSKL